MAVYTELSKGFLEELADDYAFGRVTSVNGIPEGSVNSNYLIETSRGRFLLRVDEVKSETELRREIDLLGFLRKHSFPCPQPLQDRNGRYYRQYSSKRVSRYKYHGGRSLPVNRLKPVHLEAIGRTLGELHVDGKVYKKGVDNRF